MPYRKFALLGEQQERLEIAWEEEWREIKIRLDGLLLARYPNALALKIGQSFNLSNGSILAVQLIPARSSYQLRVTHNNQLLSGAAPAGNDKMAEAAGAIFFVGGINLLLGVIAILWQVEALLNFGIGIGSIILGSIFLALGFFVRRGFAVALGLAILIYLADTFLTFGSLSADGGHITISAVLIRISILGAMIRGFGKSSN